MPAAYPLDLRERIWRACEQEQATRTEIAERFEVSVSFVRKRAARTTEALYSTLAEGLQTLITQNARAWFAHGGYTGLLK